MLTRLSSKGQLVIPKAIRETLKLQVGTQFEIELDESKIILKPITASGIETLYGRYAGDDFLAELEAEHQQELENEI